MVPAAAPAPDGTNVGLLRAGPLAIHTSGTVASGYLGGAWTSTVGLNTLGITDWTDVAFNGAYSMGYSPSTGVVVYAETTSANADGLFGDGTTTAVAGSHAIVPGTAANVAGVALPKSWDPVWALSKHACVWKTDGSALCWGGDGFTATPTPPVFADGLTHNIVAMSVDDDTCAVDDQGGVYCGGQDNMAGQLGYAGAPVQALTKVAGVANAVGVEAGPTNVCARLRDTTAMCWGDDTWGELGDGKPPTGAANLPAPVVNLTNVAALTLGFYASCALHRDGRVSCWGNGGLGDTGLITMSNWETQANARPVVGFGP
jgi:alpha-tubulin suppressor-like RCC1 family protein